jgi:hypothetical protein
VSWASPWKRLYSTLLPAFTEGIPHVLVLAKIHRLHRLRLHMTPSVLSNMCTAGVRLFERGVMEPAAALLNMFEKSIGESPETPNLHLKAWTRLAFAQVVESIGLSGRRVARNCTATLYRYWKRFGRNQATVLLYMCRNGKELS